MDTQYIKTMGEPFSIYQANRRHTIWCQQDRSRATTISHTLIPCTQIGLCMPCANQYHYNNVIMNAIVCQITASRFFTQALIQAHIKEKNQSFASLALVRGIHRWPVNSPHKGPVTRKMFPFDDLIMILWKSTDKFRMYTNTFSTTYTVCYKQIWHISKNKTTKI